MSMTIETLWTIGLIIGLIWGYFRMGRMNRAHRAEMWEERQKYRPATVRLHGLESWDKDHVYLARVLIGPSKNVYDSNTYLKPNTEGERIIIRAEKNTQLEHILGAPQWRRVPNTQDVILLGERYTIERDSDSFF